MRYRAAAIILALGAAVAIGQVPMYSDYPWGLVQDGVDRGPVWNLNCKSPLWCSVAGGNGSIQLGDGGTLPYSVAYAADAGLSQAALNAFAALWAADAGNVVCSRCILTDRIGLGAVNTDNLDAGAVTAVNILDSAIIESKLAAAAVTSGKIAASAVGSTQIADGAVLEAKVGTGAITNTKLGALSVDSAKLADGSVIEAKVGTGAVTNTKLGALAVDSGKIADGAVVEAKVGTGAITNTKIGALAVDSGKLAAAAVTTAKIATGAVTSNELGAAAVTTAKLAAGAVDNAALGDLSISSGKLQDSAVTTAKLNALAVDSTKLAAAAVTTAKLATGAVTSNELGAAAVTTAKIATGAVTSNELGAAAVTTAKLATGAVTTNELGALAVTTAKIADNQITTAKIVDNNITTSKIADNQITTAKIVDNNVTTAKITDGNITRAKVAAQAIDWSKLDDGSPIMAWDEGRGSLLSGRVTFTANGTLQAPEANQGYTSWAVTSGTTDFYVETDVQFRTIKDQFVSITYRTGGTTGWASSSTMRVFNMANTAQSATATMYGDGLWHTAVFDISAFTGTSTIRFDPQDGGAAIGAGATFWVSNVAVGSIGVGPGGGHTLSSYRGGVGVNVAKPTYQLEVGGSTAQFPTLFSINATAHATSRRAAMFYGDWLVGQDANGNGTKDFFIYGGATAAPRLNISTAGNFTIFKPTSGVNLTLTGTDGAIGNITSSSGTTSAFPQLQVQNYNATGGFPALTMYNSRGTQASPVANNSGDTLGATIWYGRAGANTFAEAAKIDSVLTAAPGLTVHTSALRFYTANAGASTERVRIAANGNVGILNTAPGRELSVKGQIAASPAGTNDDLSYNGSFISTKPTTATQHINLIRSGNRVWSLGFRPSSNTFLIAAGETTDSSFGNNQPFAIDTSGNVGIGTVAPGARLHTTATNENLRMEGTDPWASFYQSGTRKGWFGYGAAAGTTEWGFNNEVTNGFFNFRVNGTGNLRASYLTGVGNRAIYVDANGGFTTSSSDSTLKEDVQDLRATLRNALQLRPVSFLWKDKERFGSQREIGFIAQEVMQVVPEVVGRNNDGTYTIDYPKLVAVLVGAVQELFDDRTWLARRVQELEDRAQKAEDRLAQLEARLSSLENYSGIKGCGNCPQTDDGENPP